MQICAAACSCCPVSRIAQLRYLYRAPVPFGWLTTSIWRDLRYFRRGGSSGTYTPMAAFTCGCPSTAPRKSTKLKWGELHPWVDRDNFWDGVVMIYTPETLDEVDVTVQLVVDAYNYITGADLDPADFD